MFKFIIEKIVVFWKISDEVARGKAFETLEIDEMDHIRGILVSLDPAQNQCDIFERPFSDKARKVRSNLFVIEMDQAH